MVLKGCARCGGDLYREDVLGEAEMVCIQCGHRSIAPSVVLETRRVAATPAGEIDTPSLELSLSK